MARGWRLGSGHRCAPMQKVECPAVEGMQSAVVYLQQGLEGGFVLFTRNGSALSLPVP